MSHVPHRVTKPPPLPSRPADGHKGLFGRVLVVGGCADMIGAPALAGLAALRMGAGLVKLAMPRDVLASALCVAPECTGLGLGASGDLARLTAAAEESDALVIGPGMGLSPVTRARVLRLLKLDRPAVIDADALNILAAQKRWPAGTKLRAVLTPHPGEMARLMTLLRRDGRIADDDAGRVRVAVEAAGAFGQVVLLKGHRTVVTDGRRVYVNRTGDSTLAKAGSGDVLSGMIGCLLAQGLDAFDAACLGAFLHGRAGEIAGHRLTPRSALARDVIDAIGLACAA